MSAGAKHIAAALQLTGDLSWQDRALCASADPEEFFPDKGGSTRNAKRVCDSCPVRAECLAYALGNREEWGIWGGLSVNERQALAAPGTGAPRGRNRDVAECGTAAAVRRHHRHKEPLDRACQLANALRAAEYRERKQAAS